jgi:CPA1 family monovalent cation:H+ antiporter
MLYIEHIEILLCVAALVALATRRFRLPYTVGLVLAGALLAGFGMLLDLNLTQDLIFRTLLPPLIFEAALFTRWRDLKPEIVPVLILAIAGVAVSTALVTWGMCYFVGWPLVAGFAFGALISPTDPVSAVAMFKDLRIQGRLRTLVESESLFNDGIGSALYGTALMVGAGTAATVGSFSGVLISEVGGGVLCGGGVAAAILFLANRTEDHLLEITLTTVAAFGSFLLAEHFHVSGVTAVLVAGLVIGNSRSLPAITQQGREAVEAFWEFAAFVANSITFLLIGAHELRLGSSVATHLEFVAIAILISILGRAVSVYLLSMTLRWSRYRIPMAEQHVLFWGGLRGAISLALVLGLPDNFPMKDQLMACTFGVVGFSVVGQGLTLPALMKRLGLLQAEPTPSLTPEAI